MSSVPFVIKGCDSILEGTIQALGNTLSSGEGYYDWVFPDLIAKTKSGYRDLIQVSYSTQTKILRIASHGGSLAPKLGFQGYSDDYQATVFLCLGDWERAKLVESLDDPWLYPRFIINMMVPKLLEVPPHSVHVSLANRLMGITKTYSGVLVLGGELAGLVASISNIKRECHNEVVISFEGFNVLAWVHESLHSQHLSEYLPALFEEYPSLLKGILAGHCGYHPTIHKGSPSVWLSQL